MLGGIFVFILTAALAHALINNLKTKHPFMEASWLKSVFYYHAFLSLVYIFYAVFNGSDSRYYYKKVIENFRGAEWLDYYGTSTTFIEFISYPFIQYFGFSYYAMMALFSFFGFVGFVFFYLFFKENLRFRHTIWGYDVIKIFLLLPNFHFWSSSLGKGAVIFLAIAIFFYGLSKLGHRWFTVFCAAVVIYHIRPHIMLIVLVSCFLGFVFSTKGINWGFRIIFIIGAAAGFFFIYQDVLTMVGVDQDEFISQGLDLSHRARELSKATSGIDISNYSLGLQLFTFIYRPLFFDAPGILGLIVSIENVFYLWITFRLINIEGLTFLFTSSTIVKSTFLSFFTASIALAQISGNLGLAMRQKSQVMILFLFVIISFLDQKKFEHWRRIKLKRNNHQPVKQDE